MVFFNYATMQMAAKIVYYGPGLCGKTTNLHHIYTKTSPQSRGEMVSLETETDRTLFFDLLPIDVGVIGGFKTRLQLYTVPGQVFYNTTRKLVLKGVDGIVFVADSQAAMLEANVDSLKNLRENLAEIGLDLDDIPVVLQLNKRDLPNVASVENMLNALDPDRRFEHVESVAYTGVGVFETLKLISKLTLRQLRRRMTGEDPMRPPTPQPRIAAAQFRVRDDPEVSSRTIAADTPLPAAAKSKTTTAPIPAYGGKTAAASTVTPEAEPVEELPTSDMLVEEEPPAEVVPDLDRHIIAGAPVAEAPPEEPAVAEAPATEYVPPPATAPDPEIEFGQTAQPQRVEPEVKTVKVRSSVDVMAELEALRKRATNVAPKAAKRDIMADLDSLRPKRDIQRTLHLKVPHDVLPRTKTVRVTLSFEDADQGAIHSQDHTVDVADTSDVQSLSVNLKIDLAQ
jgi:mutual gliding-motility protein MglA